MKLAAENGFSSLNRAAKSDHCLNGAPAVRFYLLFVSAVDFLQWCEIY